MGNFPHLGYLDEGHSPPGLPGWTTFTACSIWMDNFYCLDCLDGEPSLLRSLGQPSLPGLLSSLGRPGWTTFAYNNIII
eukprot:2733988-Karenia_brevis.AAC.1